MAERIRLTGNNESNNRRRRGVLVGEKTVHMEAGKIEITQEGEPDREEKVTSGFSEKTGTEVLTRGKMRHVEAGDLKPDNSRADEEKFEMTRGKVLTEEETKNARAKKKSASKKRVTKLKTETEATVATEIPAKEESPEPTTAAVPGQDERDFVGTPFEVEARAAIAAKYGPELAPKPKGDEGDDWRGLGTKEAPKSRPLSEVLPKSMGLTERLRADERVREVVQEAGGGHTFDDESLLQKEDDPGAPPLHPRVTMRDFPKKLDSNGLLGPKGSQEFLRPSAEAAVRFVKKMLPYVSPLAIVSSIMDRVYNRLGVNMEVVAEDWAKEALEGKMETFEKRVKEDVKRPRIAWEGSRNKVQNDSEQTLARVRVVLERNREAEKIKGSHGDSARLERAEQALATLDKADADLKSVREELGL